MMAAIQVGSRFVHWTHVGAKGGGGMGETCSVMKKLRGGRRNATSALSVILYHYSQVSFLS